MTMYMPSLQRLSLVGVGRDVNTAELAERMFGKAPHMLTEQEIDQMIAAMTRE